MDPLTFIAAVVKAASWPTTTSFSVYLLRDPLKHLIDRMGNIRVSASGVEASFSQELGKTAQAAKADPDLASPTARRVRRAAQAEPSKELMDLAAVSPKAAVVQAWGELQNSTVKAAQLYHQQGLVQVEGKDLEEPIELGQKLLSANVLDETKFEVFRRLRALRNQAKNWSETQLSDQDAMAYIELASGLKNYMDQSRPPKPSSKKRAAKPSAAKGASKAKASRRKA